MFRQLFFSISLLTASPAAVATILIDDFSQTSDAGLYPVAVNAFGLSNFISDPFRNLGSVPLARQVFLVDIGGFGGSTAGPMVNLDTSSGVISFVDEDAPPSSVFVLTYTSIPGLGELDLDIQDQTALRVSYSVSDAVSIEVRLASGFEGNDFGDGGFTEGNTTFVDLVPGESQIDIPLSAITGAAIGNFGASLGTPAASGDVLDDVDLSRVDSLSFVLDNDFFPVSPESVFTLTIDEVAFVPEPSAAAFLAVSGLVLFRRRSA